MWHGYAALAPDDQLGVLNDTMSLAMAGVQPMSDYLDLTRTFPDRRTRWSRRP